MGQLWKLPLWGVVLGIPAAGFWVASSLAALHNLPLWAVVAAGACMMPLGPVAWELWASRRRKGPSRMALSDRLVLRTFVLNAVVLGGLVGLAPQTALLAVTARGDWFLDAAEGPLRSALEALIARLGAEAPEPEGWLRPGEESPPPDLSQLAESAIQAPALHRAAELSGRDLLGAIRGTLSPQVREDPVAVNAALHAGGWIEPGQSVAWWTGATDGARRAYLLEAVLVAATDLSDSRIAGDTLVLRPTSAGQQLLCAATTDAPPATLAAVRDGAVLAAGWTDAPLCSPELLLPMALGARPTREPAPTPVASKAPGPSSRTASAPPSDPRPRVRTREAGPDLWPLPPEPSPLAMDVPRNSLRTIDALAAWFQKKARDPTDRMRAIHDWVALNIAYDAVGYQMKSYGDQSAESVFAERKGVCAGYARLTKALGQAAGLNVVVVGGLSKGYGELGGSPHAWNAVALDGHWYLLDVTWDAGFTRGDEFIQRYKTEYLFTPPQVFLGTHLPKDEGWQLVADKLKRSDYVQAPERRPLLEAANLTLLAPRRSQVTVTRELVVRLKNPDERPIRVTWRGGELRGPCDVEGDRLIKATCDLPEPGRYTVAICAPTEGDNDATCSVVFVNRR